jgi:DNA-binding CsgD family transcriptional regulator
MTIKVEINPSFEWQEDAKDIGVSHRELEVLALLAQGFENEVIAEILRIQHQSVKNHLFSLIKKLGSSNSTEALAVAVGKNLIKITDSEGKKTEYTKMEKFLRVMVKATEGEDTELKKKIKKWMIRHGIDANW